MKSIAMWLGSAAILSGASACNSSAEPAMSSQQPSAASATQPSGTAGAGVGQATATQTPATVAAPTGVGTAGVAAPAQTPASTAGASAAPGAPAMVAAAGAQAPAVTETEVLEDNAVDWTMMGYDPGSTYFNSAETTLSKDNVAQLDVLWTADLGGNVNGGGLQIGDKIFASGPGAVKAFQAADGKELWSARGGGTCTLGYSKGTLYIHDNNGNINALSAEDGSMLWSKKADPSGADGNSSVIPVGDMLLFGASDGNQELGGGGTFRGYMAMLDAKTGDNKWTTFTVPEASRGASFWSSPSASMADGLVYGGSGNNYTAPATNTSDAIIAFDWNTGEIKWQHQARTGDSFPLGGGPDADFGSNPVLYEAMVGGTPTKMVADGTKYGNVVALDRLTGDLIWSRDICQAGSADGSRGLFTNFSYSGKSVMAACNQGGPATLFAMDPATGDIQWMQPLPGQVWGRMAFANGVGFVGTGTAVMAFDVDTGNMLKTFQGMGGTIASTITISRGRVVFGEGLSWSGGSFGTMLTVLGLK